MGSIKNPYTKLKFIDTCIAASIYYNIKPILVFNKIDLLDKSENIKLNDISKIYKNGFIKIATDWSNYSDIIIEIFNKNNKFEKINDIYLYKNRCLTKFEKRGISLGHKISELSYRLK